MYTWTRLVFSLNLYIFHILKIFNKKIFNLASELIVTGIPVGHAVNSIVPGDTVMDMPNAQVYGGANVPLRYLNGDIVPGGYASPGNDIKILEIFEGMLLVLVPVGSGAKGDGQWVIGYMETFVLGNSIWIRANTITWNSGNNIPVYDSSENLIYNLLATQPIQFLYETPNSNYMCILFNGYDGNLQTGYVPAYAGTFYRQKYLPSSPYANTPGISGGISVNDGDLDSLDTALIDYNYFLNKIGFTSTNSFSYSYSTGYVDVNVSVGVVSEYNSTGEYQFNLQNGVLTSLSGTVINNSDFEKFNITINGQNLISGILSFSYGDFGISWSTSNPNAITLTFKKDVYNENENVVAVQLKLTISFNSIPLSSNNDLVAVQSTSSNYGADAVIVATIVLLAVALGPESIPLAIATVTSSLTNWHYINI